MEAPRYWDKQRRRPERVGRAAGRRPWLWLAMAGVAGLGALAIVAGARPWGIAILVGLAVGTWGVLTVRGLRSMPQELRPGQRVRLPDGTITPMQAARLESADQIGGALDSLASDFGDGDGGGGGGS